jgi:hypothetical protein
MTIQDLLDRHEAVNHRCVVAPGTADELFVTCHGCGARLEAELLSACTGSRTDSRIILMLACPRCGSRGQLRLVKEAAWCPPPPGPATQDATVQFRPGTQGYVMTRCSCGGAGPMFFFRHEVTAGGLVLHGCVEGCGHPIAAYTPRASSFSAKDHRHG